MNTYTLDFKLWACVTVRAESEEAARATVDAQHGSITLHTCDPLGPAFSDGELSDICTVIEE